MERKSNLTRRGFLRAGSVLGGGLVLAACSPATAPAGGAGPAAPAAPKLTAAEIEAAARKESGSLLWYNTGNPALVAKVDEGFKKAYPGIDFKAVSVPFTDLPNKMVTEAVTNAPTADVIWCPPTLRELMLKNEVIQKSTVNGDADLPKETLDPEGYAHPVWQLVTSLVYNTNTMQTPPKDAYELADPSWRGKIAFDRVQNLGQATTWLSVWRKPWGDSKWNTWLDALAASNVLITAAAGAAYEAVLRGERSLAISSSNNILSQKPGTPMAMDFLLPVVPFYNHSYLTKRSTSPAKGRLFMEWATTEAGQKAIASAGLSPVRAIEDPSALKNFVPASGKMMTAADLADFGAKTDEYMTHLTKRWRG